jgi:hypothetical protein
MLISLLLIVAWVATALDLTLKVDDKDVTDAWKLLIAVPFFWVLTIIEYIHHRNETRR